MVYNMALFLHIVGVIVWIGGLLTLTVLNLRLAREPSTKPIEALSSASEFVGRNMFGPAAGLTLVAGFVMTGLTGWRMPAWVIWGGCALVVSGLIGALVIGRAAMQLRTLATNGETAVSRTRSLRIRLMVGNIVNFLILLSAVWAMTFKPIL